MFEDYTLKTHWKWNINGNILYCKVVSMTVVWISYEYGIEINVSYMYTLVITHTMASKTTTTNKYCNCGDFYTIENE